LAVSLASYDPVLAESQISLYVETLAATQREGVLHK
jgi:hypothetical protein